MEKMIVVVVAITTITSHYIIQISGISKNPVLNKCGPKH